MPSLRTSAIAAGRRDCDIKILKTFLAFLNHVLEADIFSAGFFRGLGRLAFGKNQHAHLFAASMRNGQVPRTI